MTEPIALFDVTLHQCGECDGIAGVEAWTKAWWRERSKRQGDKTNYPPDDFSPFGDYGLDDHMVCPVCGYVHADDDRSYVLEFKGRIHYRAQDAPALSS
jgi:hypothetical protein